MNYATTMMTTNDIILRLILPRILKFSTQLYYQLIHTGEDNNSKIKTNECSASNSLIFRKFWEGKKNQKAVQQEQFITSANQQSIKHYKNIQKHDHWSHRIRRTNDSSHH